MIKVDIFEVTKNYLKSKLIKSKCYKVQASRILVTTYCNSHSNPLSNCGNKMISVKKQKGKNPGYTETATILSEGPTEANS